MQTVSIYSPQWDPYDSYGIIANRLAEGIDNRHVNCISLNGDAGGRLIPSPGGILLGYPTLAEAYGPMARMGRRVAVTMFESTALPEGWVEALNGFEAVVVPSAFVRDVFRANGVTVPVEVVPLGINPVYATVQRRPRGARPYTFLALCDRGMRKGWDLAWHAFRSAFGDSDKYKLILKCRDGAFLASSADANVEIMQADLSVDEMAALYARCDAMAFPTRGEGFGLPPREFAATGGVALATGWGGTADDIHCWGVPIPYDMTDAWPHTEKFAGRCGQWAEPDVDALAVLMQTVAGYPATLPERATVAAMYDWDTFVSKVMEIYDGA